MCCWSSLDPDGPKSIYVQICDQIRPLIERGTLAEGYRLPASRVLAQTLGVDRSTVCRAYEELWSLGYVDSRPGSYTTVRRRTAIAAPSAKPSHPLVDWERASTRAARGIYRDYVAIRSKGPSRRTGQAIAFTSLSADHDLCPADEFRACVRDVLAETGKDILDYGDPAGYRPLREAIAHRMQTHGVAVSADEILITGGAQPAIDLVVRLLGGPGTPMALEVPTYALALPLFRYHGLAEKQIPMRRDGLDLGVLESVLKRDRPAFLYTIPNFHNPTGITTSQAHRERVLALCEAHRVPIVEDGFEEEMKYFGKVVLPIKSMDRNKLVIYLGTFSKVVFPGLRIGWVAADRDCIERLLAIHRFTNLSGNNLGQVAMHRFYASGHYEKHVRRVHRVYRKRMQAMIRSMRRHFPARGVTWTEPAGGYTLWVACPGLKMPEGDLVEALAARGVIVSPGSLSSPRLPKPGLPAVVRQPEGAPDRRRHSQVGPVAGRPAGGMTMLLELQKTIIYGPVRSRRLGFSLGINLLPAAAKVCTFNCLYCQYGWTDFGVLADPGELGLPTPSRSPRPWRKPYGGCERPPAFITFSGNGEPTVHPDFARIVDEVTAVRDRLAPAARTAILSNSTTVGDPVIRRALSRLDVRIMKLDAGTAAGFRNYNQPAPGIDLDSIVEGLRTLEDVTVQALFTGGPRATPRRMSSAAWVRRVASLAPRMVQIYTLARGYPSGDIRPLERRELETIGRRLDEAGTASEVY